MEHPTRTELRWDPAEKGQQHWKWFVTFPTIKIESSDLLPESPGLHSWICRWQIPFTQCPPACPESLRTQLPALSVLPFWSCHKIQSSKNCCEISFRGQNQKERVALASRCNGCCGLWVTFVTLPCCNHLLPLFRKVKHWILVAWISFGGLCYPITWG